MGKLDALAAIARKYVGELEDDANLASWYGQNGTDITSTTAQEIKAAPGAGKRIVLTQATILNKTVAEAAVISLQDDAGTPVVIGTWAVSTAAGNGGQVVLEFEPPIKLAENVALDGVAAGSLGDTVVSANGFIESV